MTLIKREFNSEEKIIKKLKSLISELNDFTKEVESVRISDINYTIELEETDNKNKKFMVKLIQTKVESF